MNKIQEEQAREEELLFKAFFKIRPDFAGQKIVKWSITSKGCDPPDIICTTDSGPRVGVEIGQWAPQNEMAAGKLRDQINQKVLEAIGRQPIKRPEHFWLVGFHPKAKSHLEDRKYKAFRDALFRAIEQMDRDWPTIRHHGKPYTVRDLENFAPLDKYLDALTFCPPDSDLNTAVEKAFEACGGSTTTLQTGGGTSDAPASDDWIVPVRSCDSIRTPYDPEDWEPDGRGEPVTTEAWLLHLLRKKASGCRESKLKTPCTEVQLLVAFHEAIAHSSPMPFNMEVVARKAVEIACRDASWPFSRTFLLFADEDSPKVYRLL